MNDKTATTGSLRRVRLLGPGVVASCAGPVLGLLAALRHRAAGGAGPSLEEAREALLAAFFQIKDRFDGESRLQRLWQRVRSPLVYTADETLSRLPHWPFASSWDDHALELHPDLCAHTSRIRAVVFFDELEETLRLHASATDAVEQQAEYELLTLFLLCLRFGFRGQVAGDEVGLEKAFARLEDRLRVPPVMPHHRSLTPGAYWHVRGVSGGRGLLIGLWVAAGLLLLAFLAAALWTRAVWSATAQAMGGDGGWANV